MQLIHARPCLVVLDLARADYVKPVASDPLAAFIGEGQLVANKLSIGENIRPPNDGCVTVLDHSVRFASFRPEFKFPGHPPQEQMEMGRNLALVFSALAGLEFQLPNGAGVAETAF